MSELTNSALWNRLQQRASTMKQTSMQSMFNSHAERASHFSVDAAGLFLDFSKNNIDQDVVNDLLALAENSMVQSKISAMFSGEKINTTENRAVLHTALRNLSGEPVLFEQQDVMPQIKSCLAKMRDFCEQVRSQKWLGFTNKPITKVVSIGIGGSFLGPKIVTEALKPYRLSSPEVVFVANVDGCHIKDVLANCDPEQTLFVMSSKSFSTQETLQNTLSAKHWFLSKGGSNQDIAKHFVAVSNNVEAAIEFGMDKNNVFPMADWVGGRYSLWSAIGLPICLSLGFEQFEKLLEGAYAMDVHFKQAPLAQNMPVILALLGVWYRNFFDAQSHALLPYSHYLRGLPAYIQQLDMESNGKSTNLRGEHVDYQTAPIIWGSEGTNGQHSFYQLIHQSNLTIPVDFILPLEVESENNPNYELQHKMLAANCFGQAQALMQGKSFEQCYEQLSGTDLSEQDKRELAAHKTMLGNKPSNTILFDKLSPERLGALIALYEHKVFVQGCIWNINSFDQWGVELGKVLGQQVLDMIQGEADTNAADPSTQALIRRFCEQHK